MDVSEWVKSTKSDSILTADLIVYGILLPLVCVLGLFGNFMNLLVFWKQQPPTFILYRCLSASDLFSIMLWSHKVAVFGYYLCWGTYGEAVYMAHVSLPMHTLGAVMSGLMVFGLTIDRYIAVCNPYKFHALVTQRKVRYFCFLSLVIALVMSCPMVMSRRIVTRSLVNQTSDGDPPLFYYYEEYLSEHWAYKYIYIVLLDIFMLVIYVLFWTLTSLTLYRYRQVRQRRREFSESIYHCSSQPTRLEREEMRLIKFLLAVFITYQLLPPILLNKDTGMAFLVFSSDTTASIYTNVAYLLVAANTSANFYLYLLFSQQFQRNLRSLVGCCQAQSEQ